MDLEKRARDLLDNDEAGGSLEAAISAQSPEAEPDFVSAYLTKFGTKPSSSADTAHDALMALSKAITLAESTDPALVAEALLKVQFEGASGKIVFDGKGGVVREPLIVKVSNNSLIPVD
jgi:branched-chain amino acid transport system substrate-binding protein